MTTNPYNDMQRAAERCKDAGIDPNRLHEALSVVARRALQCARPGDYTAEGVAAMNMNVVLDAVLTGRMGTITINGLLSNEQPTAKISAIRALRFAYKLSLKEAKDLVEEAEVRPVTPSRELTNPAVDLTAVAEDLRRCNYNATYTPS